MLFPTGTSTSPAVDSRDGEKYVAARGKGKQRERAVSPPFAVEGGASDMKREYKQGDGNGHTYRCA